MTYNVNGLSYSTRESAMRATIEDYLWADGMNTPAEIARIISTTDGSGDEDTAMNLAAEIVNDWGGDLRISTGDEAEEVDRIEWASMIRQIVGVKYSDPEEEARIIWDESDAHDIESEDPSLVIRSQWSARDVA